MKSIKNKKSGVTETVTEAQWQKIVDLDMAKRYTVTDLDKAKAPKRFIPQEIKSRNEQTAAESPKPLPTTSKRDKRNQSNQKS